MLCMVVGKGPEVLHANEGRIEVNMLLLAEDTELMTDLEGSCVDW